MTRSTSEILEAIAEGILERHAGAPVMRAEELAAAAELEVDPPLAAEFLAGLGASERLDLLSAALVRPYPEAHALALRLPRLLVDVSADDLIDVRDCLRALLVDHVSVAIRRRLPAAILAVSCANREPSGGEVPSSCIPWTARAARIEEELD